MVSIDKRLTKKKYYQHMKRCQRCHKRSMSQCECLVQGDRYKKDQKYYGKAIDKDQLTLF